ncbi:MAG TPA: C4-type zinc ribbon domain-containing protein [Kofleriaceae bacterium]|nr:C4-type zinc ribbon domain-containing protein [Kofleriaceae bacterium]
MKGNEVREQLVFLLQLQQSDVKVRELETAVNQLPTKLDPLRRDLAKLQGMLDAENAKLAETNTWRKQQQEQLDREREALKIAQSKLSASKNSKEFGAASREVENKRKSISDRESELKKVSEASTSQAAQLESRNKDVDGLRSELAASEAAQGEQVAALAAQLAEARAVRDAARGSVDKQWLKTYDTLSQKRGYAVAPVIKGVCQGCHMALPPQLNNILARMESIETCPRCSRLVYRKELLEPKPDEAAAADAKDPPKPE